MLTTGERKKKTKLPTIAIRKKTLTKNILPIYKLPITAIVQRSIVIKKPSSLLPRPRNY